MIQDAIDAANESLGVLTDLKPRADIPLEAEDLGMQPGEVTATVRRRKLSREDIVDAGIARQRLREIATDPTQLVSGRRLKAKLDELLS